MSAWTSHSGWLKAEYLYSPRQALRRVARMVRRSPAATHVDVVLPWGMRIRAHSAEAHGRALLDLGVVDLAVTEVLWRLTDPGEIVVDVGANIGCMTAALAARVGPTGAVWAFEAHPDVFEELRGNVARWDTSVRAENVAIWRSRGTVLLETPPGFATNRGLARVSTETDNGIQVPARTLDDYFATAGPSILKLDVEGRELDVLEGGSAMLSKGHPRDCVFEEHGQPPTPVTELFRARGYEVFRIWRTLRHVRLLPLDSDEPRSAWEPTNFLATRDAGRAIARLKPFGWQSLRG